MKALMLVVVALALYLGNVPPASPKTVPGPLTPGKNVQLLAMMFLYRVGTHCYLYIDAFGEPRSLEQVKCPPEA